MQNPEPNQMNPLAQDVKTDEVPYMASLALCMNKIVLDGYVDTYKVTEQGLHSAKEDKYYSPEEVRVINFFRFEGQSDPADNTILYQIETTSGGKGSLVDAYGAYSDAGVNDFMQQVESMQKLNPKKAK